MDFRASKYIDFNTGVVFLPPMTLIRAAPQREQQSLPEMLSIFESRVDVWQFGPATAMLKLMEDRPDDSVWAHSAYALVAITFTYFEMIGKILNPDSNTWRSAARDFELGFCDVYPGFEAAKVEQFRDRIRNGIYHLGHTKSHTYVHEAPDQFPADFTVVPQTDGQYYLVNPHNMTRTVVAHFPSLMERLRNSDAASEQMQRQFVRFYREHHLGKA